MLWLTYGKHNRLFSVLCHSTQLKKTIQKIWLTRHVKYLVNNFRKLNLKTTISSTLIICITYIIFQTVCLTPNVTQSWKNSGTSEVLVKNHPEYTEIII